MVKRRSPRSHASSGDLEIRQLMSGVSAIQVNLNPATHTLSITGTDTADYVMIEQHDTSQSLQVTTQLGHGELLRREFSASQVERIIVQLGRGNDRFSFEPMGAVQFVKTIDLDLGAGNDSAHIQWVEDASSPAAKNSVRVNGGTGIDEASLPSLARIRNMETRRISQTPPRPAISSLDQAARPTAGRAEISQILADVAAKYGIPGLTASVISEGKVLTGAAGVRAAGASEKVQVTDRFGNGSTTKAMTATLAAVLVERGVIRWESTIGELFPELKGTIRNEYLKVTLEQLLQHRGGVISDDEASQALIDKVTNTKGSAPAVRLKLIPEVLKERSSIPIGEFNYSNSGYVLAGAMLERVTKISYERLMKKYLFNPLGMSSATFDPPVSNPAHPRAPMGHLPNGTPAPGDRPPLAYLTNFLHPAGSDIRLNVGDWSKFIRVHLGEKVNGVQLLKPATLARLHRGVEIADGVGYASGWVTIPTALTGIDPALGSIITHNGSDGVWLAEVTALPDSHLAIAIMANATVDKNGNSLDQAAFAEIKQRLLQSFAPQSSVVRSA